MTSTPAAKQTLRRLLNELRVSSPTGSIKDTLIAKYIVAQFQKYKTTDQQLCKDKEEMHYLGQTYLCYLKSLRQYKDINTYYKGHGDRSAKDTAHLVGFKMPDEPK